MVHMWGKAMHIYFTYSAKDYMLYMPLAYLYLARVGIDIDCLPSSLLESVSLQWSHAHTLRSEVTSIIVELTVPVVHCLHTAHLDRTVVQKRLSSMWIPAIPQPQLE